MSVSPMDVEILAVSTNDKDFTAGSPITYEVTAEAGTTLHGGGGRYKVRFTLTDTTNPALLESQTVAGNYTDGNWPAPGLNTFTFTVPSAATAGRTGDIVQAQASVIGNVTPPFDSSHVVGATILLT
jgi:hypothetical protein